MIPLEKYLDWSPLQHLSLNLVDLHYHELLKIDSGHMPHDSVSPDYVCYSLACRITLHSRWLLSHIPTMLSEEGWLPFLLRLFVWKADNIFPFFTFVPYSVAYFSAAYCCLHTAFLAYCLDVFPSFPSWLCFTKIMLQKNSIFYLTSELVLIKVLWVGVFWWYISSFTLQQKFPFPFNYCWGSSRQFNRS